MIDKPYIVASSLSIIVTNETQTVRVFCEVQSSPSLTSAYWLLNGQSVNAAHRVVSQSNIVTSSKHSRVKLEVTIINSSRVDNGVFQCHAVNPIGNVSRNTTLIVNCKLMSKIFLFLPLCIPLLKDLDAGGGGW